MTCRPTHPHSTLRRSNTVDKQVPPHNAMPVRHDATGCDKKLTPTKTMQFLRNVVILNYRLAKCFNVLANISLQVSCYLTKASAASKLATKVESREVRLPIVFGRNPKDACPANRKWN